jgi:hypothetical protein
MKMNHRHWLVKPMAVLVALGVAGCASAPSSGGWVTLIDGDKGLDNWNRAGDANWRAAGGAVVADEGKGGFLVSKGAYTDFEIRAEFFAETDTNSGIFIRCANAAAPTPATCYEVNIWDIRPDPKYATGAIVDHAAVPIPIVHKAGGRWSTLEVSAKGEALTVKFNGATTVDIRDKKHAGGAFALQYGAGVKGAKGGPIRWRSVQIRGL